MTPSARLPFALATVCTTASVVMAGAAAAERGTTPLDWALVTSWAATMAVSAHLLPALMRRLPRTARPVAWLVWAGCVVATLYGHAHYMGGANQRAGAVRADAVVVDSAASRALAADLAATQARPVVQVAAEHAKAQGTSAKASAALAQCRRRTEARCDMAEASATAASATVTALATELGEARRAAELRDQQRTQATQADAARRSAQVDPVDAAIAQALGVQPAGIGMWLAIGQSLLIDVLAALLWRMALPGAAESSVTPASTRLSIHPPQPVGATRTARPTLVQPSTAPLTSEPQRGWWRPQALRRLLRQARDKPAHDIRLMPV